MTTALIGNRGNTAFKARVAVVARSGLHGLANLAQRGGHEAHEFCSWEEFTGAEADRWDIVFVDDEAGATHPDGVETPVVLVSDRAGAAAGTFATVAPHSLEASLEALLGMAAELRFATRRCEELENLVGEVVRGDALIGHSPVMRRLHGALSRAADSDATVLLEGPSGSGKSLAARIVHCKSRRSGKAPIAMEASRLDGDRIGEALAAASATTLILENIETMPAAGQAALVRHLKERASGRSQTAARIVATTAAHLPELVARGTFREDLYYRLHAFPIVLPSLRERTEDIRPIAEAILAAAMMNAPRPSPGFTPSALILLESMSWPGNVSQLEAVVRRAQALAGGAPIDREHLLVPTIPVQGAPATATGAISQPMDEPELTEESIRPFEEEEQHLLSRALRATKGNVRRAAQLLGIGRATLYRKIQQYRLRLQ